MTRRTLLIKWNRAMALFHGLFVALTAFTSDMDLSLPVYTMQFQAATESASGDADGWIVPTRVVEHGQLYVAWVALAFSALSMLFHLANAQLWRECYLRGIEEARCPSRWIEYSLSAPLQGLAIAWFTGNVLSHELAAIFGLVSCTMFFGHLTEELSRPASLDAWELPVTQRLQAHFLGYVPFAFAVGMILSTFVRLASEFPQMPDFVFGIVVTQIALFSSFTVVQLVATLRAPRHYYQGELAYMVLSLVAKGALSTLLLGNVIAVSTFRG